MFIGEYSHNLDDKGRMAVPKKFRAALGKGTILTKGFDACLCLYTKKEWEKELEKHAASSPNQAAARALARFTLASAMEVESDAQGRIVLPEYLRIYAKLKKSVIVAGLYTRLEIWDEEAWRTYTARTDAQSNEIAERVAELEI